MDSSSSQRSTYVRGLFDRIAGRYDLLNRVISLRLDAHWRKKAVAAALKGDEKLVLDLGTGTGDLAFMAGRALGERGKIIGIDFALEMLRLANAKKRNDRQGHKTIFLQASALSAPFKNRTFDAALTAFVLRNITDLPLFFAEAYRVLKPGGKLVSLDMFPPAGSPFSFFYSLYFYHLVPWLGACLARDRAAYQYLSDSVRIFHRPEAIAEMIRQAGFKTVSIGRFLQGAVCLHVAEKAQA